MSEHKLANDNLGAERFRILVIGNANAGKTTILRKVCHAQGREPIYLDANGKEITSALNPSVSCGEHNIEHQFQYPTAHGFIFHDSRGFEAGGADELNKVKDFIKRRAKSQQLGDQLHAIWYCITTSNDRGMTQAEMNLFEIGTGNVPVIAIFTKMDALDEKAFNELMLMEEDDDEEVPFEKLKEQALIRATAIFEEKYLGRLHGVKHEPRCVVQLRDMDKEGTNCDELITKTSQALNGETLRLFCLSILRNNMESRIKDVINRIITPKVEEVRESGAFSDEQAKSLFCDVMYCFPHMLPSFNELVDNLDKNAVKATTESVVSYLITSNE
jgi:GTPase SAR1 family protein